MNYTKTCKQYREEAHNLFNTQSNNLITLYLVYFLIVIGIGVLSIFKVGGIVNLLITGSLMIAFAYVSKKVHRGENVKTDDLFYGFNDFGNSFGLYLLVSIYTFLWSLLFIIPGIVKSVSYSMVYYIKNDNPDYTPSQCIEESKRIMEGHKMDAFLLMLSYIGWIILSFFTFGILLIWVLPKMYISLYLFYLDITDKQNVGDGVVNNEEEIQVVYGE